MNTSGDAADQVIRMMLNGTEVLVRLSGNGAMHTALLVNSLLRQNNQTRGAQRLSNMIRSGKQVKVYTFQMEDLPQFKDVAKQYGILYTILKAKDQTDGVFDVFVRAEDESKISRIVECFHFAQVNSTDMKADLAKEQKKEERKASSDMEPDDLVVEELMAETEQTEPEIGQTTADHSQPKQQEDPANPNQARTEKSSTPEAPAESKFPERSSRKEQSHPSEPSYGQAEKKDIEKDHRDANRKPSVRAELRKLRRERAERLQAEQTVPVKAPVPSKKTKERET